MGNQSDRTTAQLSILSRGGADLIPVFNMTGDHINSLIDTFHKFGSVEDEEGGKAGRSFMELEAKAKSALDGIEMAAAKPILEYLADHADEITDKMVQASQWAQDAIGSIFDYFDSDAGETMLDSLKGIGDELLSIGENVLDAFGIDSVNDFMDAVKGVADVIAEMLRDLNYVVQAFDYLNGVTSTDTGPKDTTFLAPDSSGGDFSTTSTPDTSFKGSRNSGGDFGASPGGNVHVNVNVNGVATPDAIAGETAKQVKAELKRKQQIAAGDARASQIKQNIGGTADNGGDSGGSF
jgi:hypothetical protein